MPITAYMDLLDNILDASINLRDAHLNNGFQDGYDACLASETGFVTGEDLGFHRGCFDVWNSVIRAEPASFSTRVQKKIKEMDELVLFVPKETSSMVFSCIEPNEKGNSTTGSQGNAKRLGRDLRCWKNTATYFCIVEPK
ncbi:hypothetical protein Tco_0810434 [Tanacetum coccineum]